MTDISKLIANSPLFSHLSRAGIYRLAELAQKKTYHKGDIIIEEGKSGMGFFIIISGKVEVIKGANTPKPVVVAELGDGEIVGEMSVIDELPHSATVRALEETECVIIEQWDFKAQLQAYPEIALQLLPVLARRLRGLDEKKHKGE
jgi:CRP/FNR family transcriptional regulator, cyclic AMP receptor protein